MIERLGHHDHGQTRQNRRRQRRQHRLQAWLMLTIILVPFLQVFGAPARPTAAGTSDMTHVDKDNFREFFALNGDARYDPVSGIVTLTPDRNDQIGEFSLKTKIDMGTSFTLTGEVNLGDRTSSEGGADGLSFAFHAGNTDDIGNAGGNLGLGGLQRATGFKLDTWHNDKQLPDNGVDGAQVDPKDSNGFGWDDDPNGQDFAQFGAFVTTTKQKIPYQQRNRRSRDVQRWWAQTDMGSAQALKPEDLDNAFHPFVISYEGKKQELTIKYTESDGNVMTWSKQIDHVDPAMAMIVSASTGSAKNLQQFKITSFDFKQAATVDVKYVDTKGNQLAVGTPTYPDGPYVDHDYATTYPETIQTDDGTYSYLKPSDGSFPGLALSLPTNGTLADPGFNGTVIYVYTKGIQVSGQKRWLDNDDAYETRPETLTFRLRQNGQPFRETTTNEAAGWRYAFDNLPEEDASGQPYHYTVDEVSVPGYQTTRSGNDFTNTLVGTTAVTVHKTWADAADQDRLRPAQVTVALLANGTPSDTVQLNSGNGWQATFGGLAKYDATGRLITYTVRESTVAGYTATYATTPDEAGGTMTEITNTHTPEPVLHLQVIKTDPQGHRLTDAEFALTGPDADETVKTTLAATPFTTTLRAKQTYTVKETQAPAGYQRNKTRAKITVNDAGTVPTVTLVDQAGKGINATTDYTYTYDAEKRTLTLTVTDQPQTVLPHTGGPGSRATLPTALALLGLAVGLAGLGWRRRREVRA
ncbi:lectin-like domain-containing protein [Lacticaseibacillus absianus]|uniref:lectin-like domain-containing protein n=1 Tax=Lacticaseibacillus absianus TaxID=2729623 RepID=UPI0015CC6247|nr:Cna B-type domain-containing protein [Lacticaseibacillus absianus]